MTSFSCGPQKQWSGYVSPYLPWLSQHTGQDYVFTSCMLHSSVEVNELLNNTSGWSVYSLEDRAKAGCLSHCLLCCMSPQSLLYTMFTLPLSLSSPTLSLTMIPRLKTRIRSSVSLTRGRPGLTVSIDPQPVNKQEKSDHNTNVH